MLYAPARMIEAHVVARLPDTYRTLDPKNDWVFAQPNAALHPVIEGPSFDREGNFYFVDIPSGRIFRMAPDHSIGLLIEYDGWPNGLKIHRDGRIFIADQKHGIMEFDPIARRIRPYLVRAGLERFKGVNDLFFASNGDLYFTDQGLTGLHDPSGRVFRVTVDGEVSCLLDNVPSPNGILMNQEENVLYVAATRGNAVWQAPLDRSGNVTKVGCFIQLSGGGGPDGMALDEEGRLAVAHVGMGCVWVFDRFGEPIYRIVSSVGRLTTNVAFGGVNRTSLYITESSSSTILAAELEVPGKLMYSHR